MEGGKDRRERLVDGQIVGGYKGQIDYGTDGDR